MLVRCRPVSTAPFDPPPPDRIDVWQFTLADLQPRDAEWRSALCDTERERADRYAMDRVRTEFVRCRGLLRTILASCVGCEPAELSLVLRSGGKPELAGGEYQFNLSHAAGYGLIAVARQPVGVDVEPLREVANADGLVKRFFAPTEQTAFAALSAANRRAGFFRGWTGKEALLKAVGRGILDLNQCVVELDPRRSAAVLQFEEQGWKLAAWEPWPEIMASIAVQTESDLEMTPVGHI
jgi:4'-phosphopantetheinyl transferase